MKWKQNKIWTMALVLLILAAILVACSPKAEVAVGEGEEQPAEAVPVETQQTDEKAPPKSEEPRSKEQATDEEEFYDASDMAAMDDESLEKFTRKDNLKVIDKYGTEEIPEGQPTPFEWQDAKVDTSKTYTCTLLVECTTILNNLDSFDMSKMEVLPEDGIIYGRQSVVFHPGESAFDVLLREMKNNKIHMEYTMTPGYNSNYIEGIQNIYEYDCGELSGWMYAVNGWYPNYGSSRYPLKDGDAIEWRYSCDLGRDLGVSQ